MMFNPKYTNMVCLCIYVELHVHISTLVAEREERAYPPLGHMNMYLGTE